MTESDLYGPILATHSRGNVRLFRQNSGFAWQGTVIEHTPSRLILANPRPLRMGAPGLSDLGGWVSEFNADLGWQAIYTAIEVKGPRTRTTPEQRSFLELVRRSGGRAGIARSVEEAGLILSGEI